MNRFKTALDIQDAVNLRAIARELVAVVDEAHEATRSTKGAWNDAAVVLLVNKIESLVRSEATGRYGAAYALCQAKADAASSEGVVAPVSN